VTATLLLGQRLDGLGHLIPNLAFLGHLCWSGLARHELGHLVEADERVPAPPHAVHPLEYNAPEPARKGGWLAQGGLVHSSHQNPASWCEFHTLQFQ
jgi:hypothetical protein